MTNLTETAEWELGVRQIETTDQVMGGPGGIANTQAQQLANRTAWLKALLTPCITAGTASAYTLTPDVPLAANAAWARYPVIFALAGEGNPTLAVSGQPALPLVFRDAGGNLVSCLPSADLFSDVVCDGSHWIVLDPPSVNLAAPGPIGGTTPAPVTGTTVIATDQFQGPGTGLTGNAPAFTVGSSNQLKGKTWEEPGTIGSTTPAPVTGTTVTATDQFKGPGTGLTGLALNLASGSVNLVTDGASANRLIPFAAGTGPQALGVSSAFFYNPATGRLYAPYFVANFGTTPYFNAIDSGGRFLNNGVDSSDSTYPGFLNSSAGLKFQTNSGSLTPLKLSGNLSTFGGPVRGGLGSDTSLLPQAWCFVIGTTIEAASNVSSVTNSGGTVTVNFATAMIDTLYASFMNEFTNGGGSYDFCSSYSHTASTATFIPRNSSGTGVTLAGFSALFFR